MARLFLNLKLAFLNLNSHKLRTFLTMLGIMIGTLALILVVSLGESAQKSVALQIQKLGSNLITILPGKAEEGKPPLQLLSTTEIKSLKNKDLLALKKLPKVLEVCGYVRGSGRISYLKKSNVATAVDYFLKITALPIINGERRNIVDNARLTVGLIYYELNAFKASVHQLSKISAKHEHYQDALLGLGWAYLKLGNYEKVIKNLNILKNRFPNTANAEESYFLLGQAYIALQDYDNSLESYRTIVELYPEKKNVPGLIRKVNNNLKQTEKHVEELKKVEEKVRQLSSDIHLKKQLGGKQIPLSERQIKLVEYMRQYGGLRIADAKEIFPMISDDTIWRDLRKLIDVGIVEKRGSTKGAYYCLKN